MVGLFGKVQNICVTYQSAFCKLSIGTIAFPKKGRNTVFRDVQFRTRWKSRVEAPVDGGPTRSAMRLLPGPPELRSAMIANSYRFKKPLPELNADRDIELVNSNIARTDGSNVLF